MIEAPIPAQEAQRLTALQRLHLLDTAPEERFDRITRIASRLFEAPIAYISLVDAQRQWFKSQCGLQSNETPRGISFCGYTILHDEILLIPDALLDDRFFDNPLVIRPPYIRFYMGCPLHGPDGHRIGTLCIADHFSRDPGSLDPSLLQDLAAIVEGLLDAETARRTPAAPPAAPDTACRKAYTRLLRNTFPHTVANQILRGDRYVAQTHASATVVQAQVEGLGALRERAGAAASLPLMNALYGRFDRAMRTRGLVRLVSTGDTYSAAAGVPEARADHLDVAMQAALGLIAVVNAFNTDQGADLRVRVGLGTGALMSGVLGPERATFQVWGTAVDEARMMMEEGPWGQVHVSPRVAHALQAKYTFKPRATRSSGQPTEAPS